MHDTKNNIKAIQLRVANYMGNITIYNLLLYYQLNTASLNLQDGKLNIMIGLN